MEAEIELLQTWKGFIANKQQAKVPQDSISVFFNALGDIVRRLDNKDSIELQALYMKEACDRLLKKSTET